MSILTKLIDNLAYSELKPILSEQGVGFGHNILLLCQFFSHRRESREAGLIVVIENFTLVRFSNFNLGICM